MLINSSRVEKKGLFAAGTVFILVETVQVKPVSTAS